MRIARATTLIVLLLTALVAQLAYAELPPLIPREMLFGNPERTAPQLSPDGTRIAWIAPDKKNVLQVWVRTVGKDDGRMVTNDRKRGIRQYFWARDDKTLIYLQDTDGDENFHVHGVDLTNNNDRDYTAIQGVRAGVVAVERDFPSEVLVQMNARDRKIFDVYRLNIETGALSLDTQNPGDVAGWLADKRLNVLGARVTTPDGGTEIRIRDNPTAPWRTWMKVGPDEILGLIAFSEDAKSAYLISSLGSDTARVVQKEIAGNGAEKVIASSQAVDAGNVVIHPVTKTVQAVAFDPGRRSWTVIDPTIKADFDGITKL
ncbi:MAG TPA: S9 family peptidase, partial [Thermoanaerobaculia bacterium]|nr:S9 family peptidase [Thermoanaerobaculia bacterium]